MEDLHVRRQFRTTWLRFAGCSFFILSTAFAAEDEAEKTGAGPVEMPLSVRIDPDQLTRLKCRIVINGTLTTPSPGGFRHWELNSGADFEFVQRQLSSELTGPPALRAVRQYQQAAMMVRVGKDHQTQTALPFHKSVIYIRGNDGGFDVAAATQPLSRAQFDLLRMPGDPLSCRALLPSRNVSVGEKWNTDPWVLPWITGLEAVTDQTLSCELQSLVGDTALIHITGKADGASLGSASSVEFDGTLTFDVVSRMLTEFKCQMKEKRTPGPVRPGADASVEIVWSQTVAEDVPIPLDLPESLFERPLVLKTPWNLSLNHSSEWHVFNQTDSVIMLRQIRNGALVSQCNISAAVVMPPGQHTPDPDFRSDVEKAIRSRAGRIVAENTVRSVNEWRIRHVQAAGNVNDVELVWDYYLCTSASGHQFSLLFSHSAKDIKSFGDEAERLLSSLSLVRQRPALPFR
ncbi:MAG: hypothetical protein MK110_04125 [Fuerstiella sp.]|nr:hypothetical protein [Fuerstiella sp.]